MRKIRRIIKKNIKRKNKHTKTNFSTHTYPTYENMKIGVIAIFKNESFGIKEWLTHYNEEGFDRAILLDNGSTDNYREQIKDFDSFVSVFDAPRQHYQTGNYNNIAFPEIIKEKIDIVAILDIDEYMFSLDGNTLRNRFEHYFKQNNTCGGFLSRWMMFGSSGYINQPQSIRKSFTKRCAKPHKLTKGVYRVQSLVPGCIGVHKSKTISPLFSCPPEIQLNHYPIQSREYFENVKMTRGDVSRSKWDHVRDWNYFNRYDCAEVDDFELSKRIII